MIPAGRFAYAQARLQARYAALPGRADWARLAGARSLAGFLEEARAGPLRAWVKPFSGHSDSHELEAGLRALYREQVVEIAAWMPPAWQAPLHWMRWLVVLPLFAHLARGGAMPAWVRRDRDLQPLLGAAGRLDPAALQRAGLLSLAAARDPLPAWRDQWRLRWPRHSRAGARELDALETRLVRHAAAFCRASPETAWTRREELRAWLARRLHLRPLQPAVPFFYLLLLLLDLERLRAALLRRALFPEAEAA